MTTTITNSQALRASGTRHLGALLALSLVAVAPARLVAQPTAVSPGAAGIAEAAATTCPTFSWATLADAQGYELILYHVSDDGAPDEMLRTQMPAGAASWTPPAQRCPGAGSDYAWAVRGLTDEGHTSWSQPLLFSTPGTPSEDQVRAAIDTLRRYREASPASTQSTRQSLAPFRGAPDAAPAPPARPRADSTSLAVDPGALTAPSVNSSPSPQAVVAPGAFSLNIDGDFDLGGFVFKDEVPFIHNDGGAAFGNTALGLDALISADPGGGPSGNWGEGNTAVGQSALRNTTAGRNNTGIGARALLVNSTGNGNTAAGYHALLNNTEGFGNVAVGSTALFNNLGGNSNVAVGNVTMFRNTEGVGNTAIGGSTLQYNTLGANNTAAGIRALRDNETGNLNTAIGFQALYNSVDADRNTAVGAKSLGYSTSGEDNTALGYEALRDNVNGDQNTALGSRALWKTTGSNNTAIGRDALRENTTGSFNTAIGIGAGFNATGDNNIRIGRGSYGTGAAEIRIGGAGYQTKTFIEGIDSAAGSTFTTDVCIDAATNQLGPCSLSSARFKEEIQPLEDDLHDRLAELDPVSFRYTKEYASTSDRTLHYGFIAEQVAEVFPSLVTLDTDGRPQTVRYDLLTPLLLAELRRQNDTFASELRHLRRIIADRDRELGDLRRRLDRVTRRRLR